MLRKQRLQKGSEVERVVSFCAGDAPHRLWPTRGHGVSCDQSCCVALLRGGVGLLVSCTGGLHGAAQARGFTGEARGRGVRAGAINSSVIFGGEVRLPAKPMSGLISLSPHRVTSQSPRISRQRLTSTDWVGLAINLYRVTRDSPYAFAASFTRYARTSTFETGFVAKKIAPPKEPILPTSHPADSQLTERLDCVQ